MILAKKSVVKAVVFFAVIAIHMKACIIGYTTMMQLGHKHTTLLLYFVKLFIMYVTP